jgi:hypothetical protein
MPGDEIDVLQFFTAALRAVVGEVGHTERLDLRTGRQIWDWVVGRDPIVAKLVADLSEDECVTVRHVLDGMLRERSVAARPH